MPKANVEKKKEELETAEEQQTNETEKKTALYPYCENVDDKNLYGFMDVSGKTIIYPCFSDAGSFYENRFCPVSQDGRWGIINSSGATVVDFEYSEIDANPSEDFWAVRDNDWKWGGVNPKSTKKFLVNTANMVFFQMVLYLSRRMIIGELLTKMEKSSWILFSIECPQAVLCLIQIIVCPVLQMA